MYHIFSPRDRPRGAAPGGRRLLECRWRGQQHWWLSFLHFVVSPLRLPALLPDSILLLLALFSSFTASSISCCMPLIRQSSSTPSPGFPPGSQNTSAASRPRMGAGGCGLATLVIRAGQALCADLYSYSTCSSSIYMCVY